MALRGAAARGERTGRVLPAGTGTFLRRRLSELAGLLLGVLGVAGLIALLSYRPSDPSLNHATGAPPANLLGRPGAFAADLLMQGLGLVGFAVALLLIAWGWRLLASRSLPHWGLRVPAAVIALLSASIALSGTWTPASWPLHSGLGGFVGDLLLGRLVLAVGLPSSLFAAAAGLIAVTLGIYALAVPGREWRILGSGLSGLSALLRQGWPRRTQRAAQAQGQQNRRDGSGRESRQADRPSVADSTVKSREPERVASRAPRPRPGKRARGGVQQQFAFAGGYVSPPLDLLSEAKGEGQGPDREALEKNARLLESVLQDFGVRGEIVKVRPGPVVTRYELEPAPGTKTSRVIGLSDDIARSMSAVSVRVAVVPGSSTIGIELPNARRETVYLRELLASEAFEQSKAVLPIILGKDIGGSPQIVDLARMPHLLVAGTTGSGKSVALNAMILSLLYRLPPERCRMIMVDPKMLELSVYDGIPHLLSPVVTEPKKAVVALKWTVREMETRYRAMSRLGVRNIDGYNARIEEARRTGEVLTRRVQTGFDPDTGQPIFEEEPFELEPLPFIVVIVDEMADLMLVAGKDVEAAIQRLAQMARAAGIHIIMATQRPSVDVITGTIKANFPTRISFHVTSKIDSRTIIGESGAEHLLGQGDMLHMAHGGRISRVHGPFVSDREVEDVVAHLKAQGQPSYVDGLTDDDEADSDAFQVDGGEGSGDELYDRAVAVVAQHRKASTSFIQRQLQIGYNRAARLVEQMEAEGVISPANHVGKREVLLPDHGER